MGGLAADIHGVLRGAEGPVAAARGWPWPVGGSTRPRSPNFPADVICAPDLGLLATVAKAGPIYGQPGVLGLPLAGTGRRQFRILLPLQYAPVQHDQGLAATARRT